MNLPSVAQTNSAKLPGSYLDAKKALANCVKVDECKEWADKAIALASYARQAQDETLLKYAKRIIVRAVDRQGEILKSIPEAKNQHDAASRDAPTRTEVAREAGLSKDQQVTAIRVNNVPRDSFETQVESDNPPTVTELASQGTKTRNHIVEDILQGRDPEDFNAATALSGFLDRCSEFPEIDINQAKRGCTPAEIDDLVNKAADIAKWMNDTGNSLRST